MRKTKLSMHVELTISIHNAFLKYLFKFLHFLSEVLY